MVQLGSSSYMLEKVAPEEDCLSNQWEKAHGKHTSITKEARFFFSAMKLLFYGPYISFRINYSAVFLIRFVKRRRSNKRQPRINSSMYGCETWMIWHSLLHCMCCVLYIDLIEIQMTWDVRMTNPMCKLNVEEKPTRRSIFKRNKKRFEILNSKNSFHPFCGIHRIFYGHK